MASKYCIVSSRSAIFKRAFSLIELLVVISIIVLLIAILIPALAAARTESQTVACLANQRTIVQGLTLFASQHQGYMVKGSNNGYGVGGATTTSDGAYFGAPQVWSYAENPVAPLNWDQVLVVDKYVNFSVLQDPADTQDDYNRTGAGPLRYPQPPIASAPVYNNLPGSYRLNCSNQPEYYQSAPGAKNTYESPIYNAYAIVSVPDPAESIVLCDGGYATGWQTYSDVATWANTTNANVAEEIGYSGNPNGGTNNTLNIKTTIHAGKFNVAFLDGHCQTMSWVDTWTNAGQPVIVPAKNPSPANLQTTRWRQIFSPDYPDQ
ncbi:MAG: prepilin-type N-terminal cleavage/methylation domain-containing protein [Planctomycetia bacterium]|nr:prepilin-type N-terminal cleavage/methylation domain-containing protein [Planctomycetia bacterium]